MKSGIANPEHVADHMYMMAVMTFFIDEEDLNLSRERYEIMVRYLFLTKRKSFTFQSTVLQPFDG